MSEQNNEQEDQLSMDDVWGLIGTAPETLNKDEKPKPKEKKEKKEKAEKPEPKKEATPTFSAKKWKFPFQIYFAGKVHDLTGMFQDEEEYTADQITKKMLEHHFYEFSGTVEYDYMEDTNTLVAMFRQHKKG